MATAAKTLGPIQPSPLLARYTQDRRGELSVTPMNLALDIPVQVPIMQKTNGEWIKWKSNVPVVIASVRYRVGKLSHRVDTLSQMGFSRSVPPVVSVRAR